MNKFTKSFFESKGIGIGIARGLFCGVLIGIGLATAFFVLAFAMELLNDFTGGYIQKLMTDSPAKTKKYIFNIWRWRDFYAVAAFFVISSGPVGIVYDLAYQKQIREKENL